MRIVIPRKLESNSQTVFFYKWDNGDVYSFIGENGSNESVAGTIHTTKKNQRLTVDDFGTFNDKVRVIISHNGLSEDTSLENKSETKGYVRVHGKWRQVPVLALPVENEIFSRFGGLIETDAIADKTISFFGVGSVGSGAAIEMAKSGLLKFIFIDHDRLEVGNSARHAAGLSHVGRYKTLSMKDLILDKNPYAEVQTWELKVDFSTMEEVCKIIAASDLVICSTDNSKSRRLINTLCVKEKTSCLFAGAFRRAYGVQVLFTKPFMTPCYQCFLMALPEMAHDEEISNQNQAQALAYSDRIVPIEPGLSIDIAPVNIMASKLAVQALLKDRETTLRSLDDDLIAPWYIWLNRREAGTQYENFPPMKYDVDGIRILRWYGIKMSRNKDCPVCGNFEASLAEQYGIDIAAPSR